MPDTIESRVLKLEHTSARLEQHVQDLAQDVESMSGLNVGLARLEGAVETIKADVQSVRGDVAEVKTSITSRDDQATQERRAMRVALYSLVGVIVAALIGGGATVLTVIL